MKITVGHILVLVSAGAYVFVGPLGGRERTFPSLDGLRTFAAEKLPYLDALKKEEPKSAVVNVASPAAEPISEAPAATESVGTPDESGTTSDFSAVPLTPVPTAPEAKTEPIAPVQAAVTTQPSPKPTVRRRRRTTRRSVKPRATASASAPKTAKSSKVAVDPLVGTYVALQLKTGNVVKGILKEKTATNYKVELPGMGAFDYPANTVKGASAAE